MPLGTAQHSNENKQGAETHLSLLALGFSSVGAELCRLELSGALH